MGAILCNGQLFGQKLEGPANEWYSGQLSLLFFLLLLLPLLLASFSFRLGPKVGKFRAALTNNYYHLRSLRTTFGRTKAPKSWLPLDDFSFVIREELIVQALLHFFLGGGRNSPRKEQMVERERERVNSCLLRTITNESAASFAVRTDPMEETENDLLRPFGEALSLSLLVVHFKWPLISILSATD